ncbi:MAG: HPr(Ser) kinase/phosphatase [Clostridia bacterium]|nr:HPr(Ser) kinase/phosphatase [Clostridia bacterium]
MDDFTSRVSLAKVTRDNNLKIEYAPDDPEQVMISSTDVNRPGLALGAGFFDHFEPKRIQAIGRAEAMYLKTLPDDLRRERITDLMRHHPAAVVIAHGTEVDPALLEVASYFEVPVLSTPENTSDFMATLISYLHVQLAPQITRHGVMVEVYGEGILITGDSGVGKSEAAIELLKRGHRLIADDAVELRKVSSTTIVGQAPDLIRYYVELRGIGVVDVRRLFGMGSVKQTEKVDMIINLEPWVQGKMYDRMGLETEYTDIMGIKIPSTTIPIKPGRNLAIVLEIAAMNNRQKKMGYNTAEEFNKKLMESMGLDGDASMM